jgi:hypothetical protein
MICWLFNLSRLKTQWSYIMKNNVSLKRKTIYLSTKMSVKSNLTFQSLEIYISKVIFLYDFVYQEGSFFRKKDKELIIRENFTKIVMTRTCINFFILWIVLIIKPSSLKSFRRNEGLIKRLIIKSNSLIKSKSFFSTNLRNFLLDNLN